MQAGPDAAQIPTLTLSQVRERVRLFRREIESVIDLTRYDPMCSRLIDLALELEESLTQAMRERRDTGMPVMPDTTMIAVVPARLAGSCPRCGSPRRCCAGSAVGGDPTEGVRP
jgi:hypothetical protein